ncbi:MAG: hypothetical protein H7175_13750 [Burkholderiales bacterium]|nr:hypothetical protein [Anaerolineae bacterium]
MQASKMSADRFMGRLLWIEEVPAPPRPVNVDNALLSNRAERAFGFSLLFSGVRCILQYVILPFVLPLVGVATEAALPISFAVNLLAIGLIVYSLRRFWKIGYRYRWRYLGVAVVALAMLVGFIALDVQKILQT